MRNLRTIPEIRVPSIDYCVYSFDYNASAGESPSTIKVSFISEDGEIEVPTLSTESPVSIIFGDKKFYYYVTSYNKTISPNGGNLLDVNFKDQSIILDRIWVGLKNRHGTESEHPIMIVGSELDPCDPDVLELDDPCNPCPDNEKLIKCLELRNSKILDVRYTLNDVLDEMEVYTPKLVLANRPPRNSFNDNYYRTDTGTLRSILSNFLNDYGFTFFWGEDGKIYFIDLREGFEINTKSLPTTIDVTKKEETASLEDTFCQGIISRYARDRQELNYNCGQTLQRRVLMPINLDVLYPAGTRPKNYNKFENVEALSILAYYSRQLRDSAVFKEIYKIDTAQSAEAVIDEKLPLLGNMQIKEVYHPESAKTVNKNIHNTLLKTFESENDDIPEYLQEIIKNEAFFMLVETDESLWGKYYSHEKALAENFLGQYYMRRIGGPAKYTNWITPDGSIQYYDTNGVLNLPFADLLTDIFTVNNRVKNTSYFFFNDDGQIAADDNFLLLQRDPHWIPNLAEETVREMEEDINKFSPRFIPIPNIGYIQGSAKYWPNAKLIMFFPLDFDFVASVVPNSKEVPNTAIQYTDHGGIVNYGLRDARCLSVNFSFKGSNYNLYGPAQGYSNSEQGTKHGGYMAIGQRESNSIGVLPKKEKVYKKIPSCDNTVSTSMNVRNIREELAKILSTQGCEISDEKLEELANNFMAKLYYTIDTPLLSETYSLCGLPTENFSIQDGLSSMDVRISNGGVETTIKFQTIRPKKPSDDLIIRNLETIAQEFRIQDKLFLNSGPTANMAEDTATLP